MIDRLALLLLRYQRLPWFLRWGLAVAWAGLIWWASSRSPSPGPRSAWRVFYFNGAHVVVFGILAALVLGGFGAARWRWLAVAVATGYGMIDEFHQSFTPGRVASGWDVLSDAVGASWAVCLATWIGTQARWARVASLALLPVSAAAVALASWV